MLVEEEAAALDVAPEEGGGREGHRHDLGGREAGLRVVAVSCGLQELFAQAVVGGYGIFHFVLPVWKRFCGLPVGRIFVNGIGGNLG